jgi:hypothetical protein
MPPATNTIAGVITDPRSRRQTAAYARTRSAIATRPDPPNPHAPFLDRSRIGAQCLPTQRARLSSLPTFRSLHRLWARNRRVSSCRWHEAVRIGGRGRRFASAGAGCARCFSRDQGPRTTVTSSPGAHSWTKSSLSATRTLARTIVGVRSMSRTTFAWKLNQDHVAHLESLSRHFDRHSLDPRCSYRNSRAASAGSSLAKEGYSDASSAGSDDAPEADMARRCIEGLALARSWPVAQAIVRRAQV